AYAGAVDHYLSPTRHDAVKILWEEPATRSLLDEILGQLADNPVLRVLDVGCGIGDGLSLLRSTPGSRPWTLTPDGFSYVGLDLDEQLLDVARWLHAGADNVRFEHGDIRDGAPAGTYDLYLSCGVPYSHLTKGELEQVLASLFTAARRNPHPAAIVVDVLGRYSIEWTTHWDQQRWPYRMSFFDSDQPATSADMTCYSGAELKDVLRQAADLADCQLTGLVCHDRSIMVGRHTSTGEFVSDLPPYRTLVNDLFDPDRDVDYDQLLFDVALPEAPTPIAEFFHDFSHDWNALITDMGRYSLAATSRDQVTAVLQPMLASGLERLEATRQRGLGVGHSLTAVAYTQPTR
ncbi:MAG: methyltransferase domain-containing protein, partial [Pseudonocardiaceae bacterium]